MLSSRFSYVVENSSQFVATMLGRVPFEQMERFAAEADQLAHRQSRGMTHEFRSDESILTDHAARMKTLAATIRLLRDGLVPALRIDRDNPALWMQAVEAMGYIRADCEAMMCFKH